MAALPIFALVAACAGGNGAGIARPPEYAPAGQTKCSARVSQSEPLIVEWPSAARGQLEAIVENRRAVAVVHYEGCEMKVLPRCSAPGQLAYVAFRNQKLDSVHIRNADDLYANLPVGAAGLEAKLQSSGELTVDVSLVGRFEADSATASRGDLKGECDGATHVVRAVTVGAFDFHTGAASDVSGGAKVGPAGVGASSSSSRETLAKDGATAACDKSATTDVDPPANCGALVRIEVVPLSVAVAAAPVVRKKIHIDGFELAANVGFGAFDIDETEVAVGAYKECMTKNACRAPHDGSGCNDPSGDDQLPVNCVTPANAMDYCAFAGANPRARRVELCRIPHAPRQPTVGRTSAAGARVRQSWALPRRLVRSGPKPERRARFGGERRRVGAGESGPGGGVATARRDARRSPARDAVLDSNGGPASEERLRRGAGDGFPLCLRWRLLRQAHEVGLGRAPTPSSPPVRRPPQARCRPGSFAARLDES